MKDGTPAPSFPLPQVIDVDQEFWNAVQQERLLLPRCRDCGLVQFFPRPACVACLGANLAWEEASGLGTVYAVTLVRVPRHPAFRRQVEETGEPVVFAEIALAEGVRVLGQIVGVPAAEVRPGASVRVVFEPVAPAGFKLFRFRLE